MYPTLKTKMQRPTRVIISIIAAANESRTQPMRSGLSPNVNQVKLWRAWTPASGRVQRKAKIDNASAMIWPTMASPAAGVRREFDKVRTNNEVAKGTAGISQRYSTIQELILLLEENVQGSTSNPPSPWMGSAVASAQRSGQRHF